MSQNKQLYIDYSNLSTQLEIKNSEVIKYRSQLSEIIERNERLTEEKEQLENKVYIIIIVKIYELRDLKNKNKIEVERIYEDNQNLKKIIRDDEIMIKNLEEERDRYMEMNQNLQYENTNLIGKLRTKEDSLNYQSNQLDESNRAILRLTNIVSELEKKNEKLQSELDKSNYSNNKQFKSRKELEKAYEDLENILNDKDMETKRYLKELDNLTVQKEKLFEDNAKMYNDIEKLKDQIYILNEQNTKVNIYILKK
jgi:chromosome segregation ATPase